MRLRPLCSAAWSARSARSRPTPPPPDDQVEELLRKARRALDNRDREAAREAFEAVLRLDPNNARAHEALRRLREGPPGGPPPRRPPG